MTSLVRKGLGDLDDSELHEQSKGFKSLSAVQSIPVKTSHRVYKLKVRRGNE